MSVDPTPWNPDANDRPPMRIIFEMFRALPRQGPGSEEATLKAWNMLEGLPDQPAILNIGCGTGGDALTIARVADVRTTAIDIDQPSLDYLAKRAAEEGLSERITPVKQDLTKLKSFPAQSFDVLWAEGSVFLFGFKEALLHWKRLLNPRGFFVISDVVWFTDDRPQEVVDFWAKAYPDMRSIRECKNLIRDLGYELLGQFTLPEKDWWDPCYTPLEASLPALREKYKDDPDALIEIEDAQTEIEMFKKYAGVYGYSFFVLSIP